MNLMSCQKYAGAILPFGPNHEPALRHTRILCDTRFPGKNVRGLEQGAMALRGPAYLVLGRYTEVAYIVIYIVATR
jgi:hypothetical protein